MSDPVTAVVERAVKEVGRRVVSTGGDEDVQSAAERLRERRLDAMARAAARSSSSNPGGRTPENGGTAPSAIREMADGEDCPVCTSLLEAVARMDEPRRTRGVAEYGEFRSALDEGEDAAAETLRETEVLRDAVQEVRGL